MTQKVGPDTQVHAHYSLTDAGGQVRDQSTEDRLFCYIHGRGQLLPALEEALVGSQQGDRVEVTLSPEKAFGEHRPELVFEAFRDNLPPGIELRPGMRFAPGGQQGRFSLKVVSLTEKGAMLDGNHPYAGETLTWVFDIVQVEDKTPSPHSDVHAEPIRWVELN